MVFRSLLRGVADLRRNSPLIVIFYAFNLIPAWLLTVPLRHLLNEVLAHSVVSKELAREVSFEFLSEFLHRYGEAVRAVLAPVLYVWIAYVVLQIYLVGGAMEIFYDRSERFSLSRFFQGCGRFFFRYLRLSLIAVFVGLPLVVAITFGAGALAKAILPVRHGEAFWTYTVLGCFLLAAILFCIVDIIFDYAKIATCIEARRDMFKTTLRSVGFTFRNVGQTLALYFILIVSSLVLLGGYWTLSRQLQSDSSWAIAALFSVQQLYILLRTSMKLLFYSSQMVLYKAIVEPHPSLSYYDAEQD